MAGPGVRSFSSSLSFSCSHCLPPPVSLGPLSLDVWLADLRSRSDFLLLLLLLLLHFGRAYIFFLCRILSPIYSHSSGHLGPFSRHSSHAQSPVLYSSPPPLLDCARALTARLLTATWPLTWHTAQPPANFWCVYPTVLFSFSSSSFDSSI